MSKTEQRLQLSAVLPKSLYDNLKDIAGDEYMSVAALVRQVLAGYVKNRNSAKGKLKNEST